MIQLTFVITSFLKVILAILLSWLFAYLLTRFDVFPDSPSVYGYLARTDIRASVIQDASWFKFPYPGTCDHSDKQSSLAFKAYICTSLARRD